MLYQNRMYIALITGGISAERDVSLNSGRCILKALRENGHKVRVIDPMYGSEMTEEDVIFKDIISKDYPSLEKLRKLQKEASVKYTECVSSSLFEGIDIAFNGLHGKFGEDGKIQTLLELRGIPYTGSGVAASVIAMDKHFSKSMFLLNGIKTPEWVTLYKNKRDEKNSELNIIHNKIGIPCVVKPNDEGSTVGLTIVKEISELEEAINKAFRYSDKVLVEKYIKGREITVAILGSQALPVIEIIPKEGFYDYEHKYTKGKTDYICPAVISGDTAKEAMNTAVNAHNSLECSVYSRVDFLLSDDEKLYCLEVNTLPGMTELSLVPKAANAVNIGFNELIQKITDFSMGKQDAI